MANHIVGSFTIKISKHQTQYEIQALGLNNVVEVEPHPFIWLPGAAQENTLRLFQDPIKVQRVSLVQCINLGQAMYQAVFTPGIAMAMGRNQATRKESEGIRIRLLIEPPELAHLPWELMHDHHDFIALRSNYPLVRGTKDAIIIPEIAIRGKLKILYAWAEPNYHPALELKESAEEIKKLLSPNRKIHFEILENATLARLQSKLLDEDYHILCFAGHGTNDSIFLEKSDDIYGDNISSLTLARALEGKLTRLVFLAACETAKSTSSGQMTFGESLIHEANKTKAKLPSVVAMQYIMRDDTANPFTARFFEALASFKPVDAALSEARKSILDEERKSMDVTRDVIAPVIYLQSESSNLFRKAPNWPAIGFAIAFVIAALLGLIALSNAINSSTRETEARATAVTEATQRAYAQAEVTVQAELGAVAKAVSQARQLANESQVILEESESGGKNNITLAILLAIESLLRTPTREGEAALSAGLNLHPQILTQLRTEGSITGVHFTADGRKMVAIAWKKLPEMTFEGVNSVLVFDTTSWEKMYEIIDHSSRIGTLVTGIGPARLYINESNSWLGLANGKEVVFYDLDSGNPIAQSVYSGGFAEICGSTTNKALVRSSNQIVLFDFVTNTQQVLSSGNDARVFAIDNQGQQIVRKTEGGVVLQNLVTQEERHISFQEIVKNAIFSTDGRYLALGGDYVREVLDIANNQVVFFRISDVHRSTPDLDVSDVAFNPDGNNVLVEYSGESRELWQQCASRELSFERTTAVEGSILTFAPSATYSALIEYNIDIAYANSLFQLYNSSTRQIVSKSYDYVVENADFSPDSQFLALAGGYRFSDSFYGINTEAIILNVPTGTISYRLPHDSHVTSVSFSPNNHWVASGDIDGTIRIWELNAQKTQIAQLHHFVPSGPIGSINRSTSFLNILTARSDGKYIATGSSLNFSVKLWSTDTWKEVAEMVHKNAISSIVFSPNGQWLATGERCFQFCEEPIGVNIWDMDGNKVARISFEEDYQETKLFFSSDNSTLIIQTDQETVELWSTNSWERSASFLDVSHSIITENGEFMALTRKDGTSNILDIYQRKETGYIPESLDLAFSFDGHFLAWVSSDGFIQVDDLFQEENVSFKIPYSGEIKVLSFSPTGQWLSVLKDDNSVFIWDVTTQEQVAAKINPVPIESVSFSSNNKLLLMAPEKKSVYVWDPFGGADDVTIVSVATKFAQYNHIFTSFSNEVRIFDASSGIEVSRFLHNEPVLDFVVNQEYVITSTEDGSAYVWMWSQTNLITEACSRLTRNLSQTEWATYFSNEPYRQTCPNLIE